MSMCMLYSGLKLICSKCLLLLLNILKQRMKNSFSQFSATVALVEIYSTVTCIYSSRHKGCK